MDFSVCSLTTIQLLLALAALRDLKVVQLDIVGNYINGKLKEDIYMHQSEIFEDSDFPYGMYKLQRSFIIQIKTICISLAVTLAEFLSEQHPFLTNADPCLFVTHSIPYFFA
eukprot:Ihof_evm17s109 gene=Ihof_evmTU17s109